MHVILTVPDGTREDSFLERRIILQECVAWLFKTPLRATHSI
nr:MAG TPA: hypothetical protein [Caudoviricetes sp.]